MGNAVGGCAETQPAAVLQAVARLNWAAQLCAVQRQCKKAAV